MKRLLVSTVALCLVVTSGAVLAKGKNPREKLIIVEDTPGSDFPPSKGLFRAAQAETIWLGADPTGTSVVQGGVWDFDSEGVPDCPNDYIANGAFSQGWTSENPNAQKGLFWHAEDFTHPDLSCSSGPLSGDYSAWCGLISTFPEYAYYCWQDAPGYGKYWNQWICTTATLAESNSSIRYTFRLDIEPGYDYAYVIIDTENVYNCGEVSGQADTLRCYTGTIADSTEYIDLSGVILDPDLCDIETTPSYDGMTVKLCFVVVDDGSFNDEDGGYATCDGAFTLDDVIIETAAGVDTINFEDGTLQGFAPCTGWDSGDYAAIRDQWSFENNDPCYFDNCDMQGCVLTFFDANRSGQYGNGGHYPGYHMNRAWSPVIDLTPYSSVNRKYVLECDMYADIPFYTTGIVYGWAVNYAVDSGCPSGPWSGPLHTSNWYSGPDTPQCGKWIRDISSHVPSDAESLKVSLGVFNWGCGVPGWTNCTEGNESPIFDNIRVGIYGMEAPVATMRYNYNDAFPEADELSCEQTALIDVDLNVGSTTCLRLGDTLAVHVAGTNAYAELCFKVIPGPCTDLGDDFFVTWFPGGNWEPCSADPSDNLFQCARMAVVAESVYASVFHEDDPLYSVVGGSGVEILPDSLFTPGTKIYYYIRTSYLPGPGPYAYLPRGADEGDLSTMYEVEVLPDVCRDPGACLLYVDYFNRGAQGPIEDALMALGRIWDRFDKGSESSFQGNGIGNRQLGAGKSRARGPIGPSLSHLQQYKVILVNNGTLDLTFSDGGTSVPGDPTDDITFLDGWINEGEYKGLWLSGNNIATELASAVVGPKPGFLSTTLGAVLVGSSYRDSLVGHPPHGESCRELNTRYGQAAVDNYYDTFDVVRLTGSGCPQMYDFDGLDESGAAAGLYGTALLYDRTDLDYPPGYYVSVDHMYSISGASPFDTVRTKIDGFSLHLLRDYPGDCRGQTAIALWLRDVLGGFDQGTHPGYFNDAWFGQYCPPFALELIDVPGDGGRKYANALFQNYPNPFGSTSGTVIRYSVARAGVVEIFIFDVAGRLVNTIAESAKPGDNFVVWDGKGKDDRRLASGVYFYQLKADGFTGHKKMLLVN